MSAKRVAKLAGALLLAAVGFVFLAAASISGDEWGDEK